MVSRLLLGLVHLLLAVSLMAGNSFAEQLPVRTYTTGDGLPRDAVTLVRQDSRGFIWLAAGDGLSRFDGYKFTNYTTDDGLADRRVNDLLETRNGVYWIATEAGLCRFNPIGISATASRNATNSQSDQSIPLTAPLFTAFNPGEKPTAFNALLEDETGGIWCATSEGLYRLEVSKGRNPIFRLIEFGVANEKGINRSVATLLKDRHGILWFSVGATINRLLPDGRVEQYSQQGLPLETITSLLEDHEGNIWAGTQKGLTGSLLKLIDAPDPSHSIVSQTYRTNDGFVSGWVNKLLETHDGKLWAATIAGLYLISISAGGEHFQLYDSRNGLCGSVWDLAEDRDGNLWVASACGVQKVARNGFTGYGPADGLSQSDVNSIFEDRDGALFVISKSVEFNSGRRTINQFDGARFRASEPNLPLRSTYQGWGWGQTIIQDHNGEWWIPTFGVYRIPKVARIEDLARARPQVVKLPAGYELSEVFRIYEDSRGDVWMATTGLHHGLLRLERTTGVVHDQMAGLSLPPNTEFSAFAQDHAGYLWIGTSEGLLRHREGTFKHFTTADGIPAGWIIWLYLDDRGRLWIASQLGGLLRIDDPSADKPRIVKYMTADGLSSNNVRTITEDQWGRIYVGTGHGVDRLDVERGGVKHFTVADGLPRGVIEEAYRDRRGALWFGSTFGLSRFVPEKEESLTSPSIYLTGLRIEGVTQTVSELGATELPTFDLSSVQRQVSIDFVGLGTNLGEELHYQYSLANDVWSAPTTERTVNFASLRSGSYRFRVRALDADGRVSSSPATFVFKIAVPIWQQAWFLALAAIALLLAIYSLYRYRLKQLLELERIRTRIATDLHDDVGSGLSQVSILSEVISRRIGNHTGVTEQLSSIGSLSRDLVDSMSDIVWAINPGRDRLSDLSYRMRRFASDLFSAHGLEFVFDAPNPGRDIRLGPEMRREFYLIFKEAVNNVVSHSLCTAVEITFLITDRALELSVHDNGDGFDPDGQSEGNGLANMQLRAKKLAGELTIRSNGNGTRVNLKVPLDRRGWFRLGLLRNRE